MEKQKMCILQNSMRTFKTDCKMQKTKTMGEKSKRETESEDYGRTMMRI